MSNKILQHSYTQFRFIYMTTGILSYNSICSSIRYKYELPLD